MMKETIPEILRNNLSNTVLYLKVIGIENILQFDFLTPPNVNQIVEVSILSSYLNNEGHIILYLHFFPLSVVIIGSH